MIMAPWSANKG